MLEIRPNCEICDKDLPADSTEARICSYECTYCANCAKGILHNVCPTCGGGLALRPIRPKNGYRSRPLLGLASHPASQERKLTRWTRTEIANLVDRLKNTSPQNR